ncbi:spermidine synthase [Streptomyces sp. NBC_01476]|uniref:spermidine synthase n=1 Tax=Streptomyces sp. NBC_01476 TaxID=2903881 RepID=UPI002E3460D5|nr:spermidine synthase [Streptomyces sp. NBC_01476]
MSARFQEIDWRPTPMGEISLRRRRDPESGEDVYEVKLGEEFLMSSRFTAGEVALARLGLAEAGGTGDAGETGDTGELDVVVGGLGLGYTARAALDDPRVRSLIVVDALGEVIDWHRRGLVPLGAGLAGDPRCRLVQGDFFVMAGGAGGAAETGEGGEVGGEGDGRGGRGGFDPESPGRRFHAVLLDVDHSPRHVLHPSHAGLYTAGGLRALAARLHPGGVFALWSNDPPDEDFAAVLAGVFPRSRSHVVTFDNPLQGGTATNTVYVATRG